MHILCSTKDKGMNIQFTFMLVSLVEDSIATGMGYTK